MLIMLLLIYFHIFHQIREVANHIEYQWSNVLSEKDKKSWELLSLRNHNVNKRKAEDAQLASNTEKVRTTQVQVVYHPQIKNHNNETSSSSKTNKKGGESIVATTSSLGEIEFLKPKRPMTAYLFFAQEMRPKIKSLHPEYTGLTVTKELGKLWAGLSVMLKLKYKQLEETARNAYLREVREWQKRYHPDDYLALEEARQMHSDITREKKKLKKKQAAKKNMMTK